MVSCLIDLFERYEYRMILWQYRAVVSLSASYNYLMCYGLIELIWQDTVRLSSLADWQAQKYAKGECRNTAKVCLFVYLFIICLSIRAGKSKQWLKVVADKNFNFSTSNSKIIILLAEKCSRSPTQVAKVSRVSTFKFNATLFLICMATFE